MSNKHSVKQSKKPSCPYQRRICYTDSTVCGEIGQYLECPLTIQDKLSVEIREGGYRGDNVFALFRERGEKK